MAKKDDQQTNVRLPAALKERITAAAEAAGRSFTAEVVRRLEASFESVLEATLLQARLAERGELLAAQLDNEERLVALAEALNTYDERTVPKGFVAMHKEHIQRERGLIESAQAQLAEYLRRNSSDLRTLSDNLQERLRHLESQDF